MDERLQEGDPKSALLVGVFVLSLVVTSCALLGYSLWATSSRLDSGNSLLLEILSPKEGEVVHADQPSGFAPRWSHLDLRAYQLETSDVPFRVKGFHPRISIRVDGKPYEREIGYGSAPDELHLILHRGSRTVEFGLEEKEGSWAPKASVSFRLLGRGWIDDLEEFDVTGHTATRLQDGQVLIAGGTAHITHSSRLTSIYRYLPKADRFDHVASLVNDRSGHSADLLPDGNVLIAGGVSSLRQTPPERIDVQAHTSQLELGMQITRVGHTATALPNGDVVVCGGWSDFKEMNSVEVYRYRNRTWDQAASLRQGRSGHTATLLPDGRILVAGGEFERGMLERAVQLESVEVCDPASLDMWVEAQPMPKPRSGHWTVVRPDGHLLVVGGGTSECLTYDPDTGAWTAAPPLLMDAAGFTLTLLDDGTAVLIGGEVLRPNGTRKRLKDVQILRPGASAWEAGPPLQHGRSGHTATLLQGRTILVLGGVFDAPRPHELVTID